MKKRVLRAWLLVALLVTGCQRAPVATPTEDPLSVGWSRTEPESAASTEAWVGRLILDQPTKVDDLRLLWTRLRDSRCPAGVQCVWQGEAEVTLEVREGTSMPAQVELRLRSGIRTPPVSVGAYRLRLLEVTPYPQERIRPGRDQHAATVRVERLSE